MKAIVRPTEFKDKETSHQWYNGYVLIPKGHPLHGVYHEDIYHDCIIELSLSGLAEEHRYITEIEESDLDSWIIGFHTYHVDNHPEDWQKEDVASEVSKLKNFVESIKSKDSEFIGKNGKPRYIKDIEDIFGEE